MFVVILLRLSVGVDTATTAVLEVVLSVDVVIIEVGTDGDHHHRLCGCETGLVVWSWSTGHILLQWWWTTLATIANPVTRNNY